MEQVITFGKSFARLLRRRRQFTCAKHFDLKYFIDGIRSKNLMKSAKPILTLEPPISTLVPLSESSSPSNSSYPPPPQKYARLSISAPKRKGQEDEITAPLSTFRSLGAIQKKQKRKSSETHVNKVSSKFKCIECLDAFLLSRCCKRKRETKEPEFEVFQQPDPGQEYTFPEYAAYMVRSKKKYLLSQMEGTIPYDIEKHCWREWGFSRINRILSHGSDSDLDRKTGYKPPRISESEVSRIYRSGLYMKEGWEQWAKMRYPNGVHTYGPPLP